MALRRGLLLCIATFHIVLALPFLADTSDAESHGRHDAERRLTSDEADRANEVITMSAGGRRFQLGGLYDARTDTAISGFFWQPSVLEKHTYRTPASFTQVEVGTTDTIRAKQELMKIDAEMALTKQLTAGTLNVKSSFNFIEHKRSTSQSIQMTAAFFTRTAHEQLDAFSDTMLQKKSGFILGAEPCPASTEEEKKACQKATHVVTAVTWGANVFATFESFYRNTYERDRTHFYLKTKLKQPADMDLEAELDYLSDDELAERSNQTKVLIYGDFRLDREMPTSVDDAISFFRALPEQTDTLFGDGVPMEVVLTPLSWFDNTAAKLQRKINADTTQRFLQIYEGLESSEALLSDLVNRQYGGFRAWKVSADAYFNDFRKFKSKFSLDLFETMSNYKAGYIDQSALEDLELAYLDSAYTESRVMNEVERRRDTIINLMSLVSEFKDAQVTFAQHLSDFFAPTFDARFDRVYALILVGFNPNADRSGIARVRDFINLARSRLSSNGQEGVKHCVERAAYNDPDAIECSEQLGFVAIHVTSFCQDFCRPGFCQLDPAGNQTCPSAEPDMPTGCWLGEEDAETLRCHVSKHVGKCSANKSSEHHITNNNRPFSDCWCACPKTQVIEYYRSQPAKRLTDELPRPPREPKILEVVGHDVPERLPFKQTAMLHLDPSHFDNARNYRVTLLWDEPVQDGAIAKFHERQAVQETVERDEWIPLRNLAAGRSYRLEVQGLSKQGAGRPAVLPGAFQAAHRMATVTYVPVGKRPATPRYNEGPGWLPSRTVIQLSVRAKYAIESATVHEVFAEPGNISRMTFDSSDEPLLTCMDPDQDTVSETMIECYMAFDSLAIDMDKKLQLRVWDITGLLAAISDISLLLPSKASCKNWGTRNLFCPTDSSCVTACSSCEIGMIAKDGECSRVTCPNGQIWCPAREMCLNSTARPADVCEDYCRDGPGQDGMGATLEMVEDELVCLSRCNVSMGNGLTSALVKRGETLLIKCEGDWYTAQGTNTTFTCPAVNLTEDDLSFVYDETAVMKHTNGKSLPECRRCPADQVYDEKSGICRFERGAASGWNFATGGDFDEVWSSSVAAPPFESIGSPQFSRVTPGAGGSTFALQLHRGGIRQKVSQQLLNMSTSEASPPPPESIWRGSVLYQVVNFGTTDSQLCLRDRLGVEPVCVALVAETAGVRDTRWQMAEVRLVASQIAELLAVEVYAGARDLSDTVAVIKIDRLAVEKISDDDGDSAYSPKDIVRAGWEPLKGMIAYFRGECPEGWQRNREADGRVTKAATDPSHVGSTQGIPLSHKEQLVIRDVPSHAHQIASLATTDDTHRHIVGVNSPTWYTSSNNGAGTHRHSSTFGDHINYASDYNTHSHTVPAHSTDTTGDSDGVDVTMPYVEYMSCIFVGF